MRHTPKRQRHSARTNAGPNRSGRDEPSVLVVLAIINLIAWLVWTFVSLMIFAD